MAWLLLLLLLPLCSDTLSCVCERILAVAQLRSPFCMAWLLLVVVAMLRGRLPEN
jgi:hypothetical protein